MRAFSGVDARPYRDMNIWEVDTRKARYKGKKYQQLDNFERRKFENLLILEDTNVKSVVLYDGERRRLGNPR